MKQLAIILSLVSLLLMITAPAAVLGHHHSEEETSECHQESDCENDCADDCTDDCGCICHASLYAVVSNAELIMNGFTAPVTNHNLPAPIEPPPASLDQPPKLFS